MQFFNAKVHGGRLTLDEPTELPDGTLVELVPTDTVVWLVQLDERTPLVEADAGQALDLGEVLAGLRSSHTPSLKAHVQNRRLVLDEPTDLRDGTVVEIAPIDDVVASGGYCLGDQAQATLERVIGRLDAPDEHVVAAITSDTVTDEHVRWYQQSMPDSPATRDVIVAATSDFPVLRWLGRRRIAATISARAKAMSSCPDRRCATADSSSRGKP